MSDRLRTPCFMLWKVVLKILPAKESVKQNAGGGGGGGDGGSGGGGDQEHTLMKGENRKITFDKRSRLPWREILQLAQDCWLFFWRWVRRVVLGTVWFPLLLFPTAKWKRSVGERRPGKPLCRVACAPRGGGGKHVAFQIPTMSAGACATFAP